MTPTALAMRKPLSLSHPALYWLRVWQKRLFRAIAWCFPSRRYARTLRPDGPLTFRHGKHTSKLIRRLGNTDIAWQYNKVVNIRLALERLNGIVIGPQEHFSFWRLVGQPTRRRGFLEGMELSFGEARPGVGGGLCQLSNLIHWMALHSPLQVVERSNHSFDPFPDDNRVLPFGSGAAVFYNYVDLTLFNPTDDEFQFLFDVGEHQLTGELRSSAERRVKYHVHEKNHRFVREGRHVYRENEIWRDISTTGHNPVLLASDRLYANRVIVKYPVDDAYLDETRKGET